MSFRPLSLWLVVCGRTAPSVIRNRFFRVGSNPVSVYFFIFFGHVKNKGKRWQNLKFWRTSAASEPLLSSGPSTRSVAAVTLYFTLGVGYWLMANFDTTKINGFVAKCCCGCMINHVFCTHFDSTQIMLINYALKRCNCMYGFLKEIKSTQLPCLNCVVNHIPNAQNRSLIKNGG